MCGNIKQFPNYIKSRIFAYENILNISIEMQNKIIDLVETSFNNNNLNPLISINDYNNVNADEKYGIPIKIIFNNNDIFDIFMEEINKLHKKKLNAKSRIEIKNTFNIYSDSYEMINLNNDVNYKPFNFDDDIYIIKNIKIINKNKNEEYHTKYPIIKINSYLDMKKRYKAEDKNCCEPGECIVYVINDDFPDFPNKGTIFVTFWQKSYDDIDI
jgi:hypothetical protein